MKKTLCLLLAFSLLALCFVGCDKKAEQPTISLERITFSSATSSQTGNGSVSATDNSTSAANDSAETSVEASADNSAAASEVQSASEETSVSVEPEPQKMTVSDVEDIMQIPFLYVDNFVELTSFQAVTEGSTKALIVDQSINTLTIKRGEYAFTNSKSDSAIVKTEHTAYFHREKVLHKFVHNGQESDYEISEVNDYLAEYGVYPIGRAIEGFTITEETVLSVEKNGDVPYSFIIKLDGEKAGAANKIQMKKYGDFTSYPKFKSVTLVVTMTNDFMPVSVELTSVYDVNYLFDIECTQQYTVTYSNVNGEVSFPEEENLNKI